MPEARGHPLHGTDARLPCRTVFTEVVFVDVRSLLDEAAVGSGLLHLVEDSPPWRTAMPMPGDCHVAVPRVPFCVSCIDQSRQP